jgi:hypothetical protein
MKTLVITGNHPRHNVFINAVEKYIQPDAYIICDRERMIPSTQPSRGFGLLLKRSVGTAF